MTIYNYTLKNGNEIKSGYVRAINTKDARQQIKDCNLLCKGYSIKLYDIIEQFNKIGIMELSLKTAEEKANNNLVKDFEQFISRKIKYKDITPISVCYIGQ